MPTPRPLGEVLDYLAALGFDHLYLRQPSSRGEQIRQDMVAARQPAAAPQPAPTPGSRWKTGPAKPESGAGASPEERYEKLEQLRLQAATCTRCALAKGRQNVVFGSGHPNADVMLVGEGPGAEEDRQGLPFVGPAGTLLTRILEAIGLRREEVYIANTVKCRPPRNRDPEAEEVASCRPFLEQQIDLVQPKLIVVLGRVAAQTLLQSQDSLGRLRGSWHQVRGVPARATYHPAALLRYEKYKRPTWEDMKIVRDRLHDLRR